MFDRTDIERVREMTNLASLIGEHIALTPKGREHVGLCPFHDDKNPSFSVVTDKGNHFYICNSCGAAGDCFRFTQEFLRKDFSEAIEFLADRVGIQLERGSGKPDPERDQRARRRTLLKEATAAALEFFKDTLDSPAGQDAQAVIERRSIRPDMVERFQIGAAPAGWDNLRKSLLARKIDERVLIAAGLLKKRSEGDGSYDAFRNRLIFPIHDDTGHPIAFGARAIAADDEPKYLNSAEHDIFHKGQTLYGLHLARPAIARTKQAIVTEGYTDVMACHAAGIEHVVGTLGTALTDDHVRKLARLSDQIILIFDGDEAGQRAAERAVRTVFKHPVDVGICVLPDGQDPDDMLKSESGIAEFQLAIDKAQDSLDFLLARFRQRVGEAKGLSGQQRLLEQFIESLRTLGLEEVDGLRKSMLINRISDLMRVPSQEIERLLRRQRGPATAESEHQDQPASPTSATGARQVAERELLAVVLYRTEGVAEIGISPGTLLDPSRFLDPVHQALASTLCDLLQANPPTMQAVLGRLDEESHRETASRLFFVGERLANTDGEQHQEHPLARATRALEDCIQEDLRQQETAQWRNRDESDDRTAADLIQKLGSRRRPSAILRTGNTD
jgi:DNA primase